MTGNTCNFIEKGVFSVEESEKILLRLAQITEDILGVKEENFRLTRDFQSAMARFETFWSLYFEPRFSWLIVLPVFSAPCA